MFKKISSILILTVLLLGITVQTVYGREQVTIKYLGWDTNYNVAKMQGIINATGKIVYVENYYSIDSNGKPKFYSSGSGCRIITSGVPFEFNRPNNGRGQRYSLIEKYLLINNTKTNSTWYDLHKNWK